MIKVLLFALLWKSKRVLLGAPKMDFMRLRNESTLTMILVEISTEIIYQSKYLCRSGSVGVSKYWALTYECSPLLQPCVKAMMWRSTMSTSAKVWLSSLAFDTRLASGLMPGTPKVRIVQYRDGGLCHLPPQMKNKHGSMRKKLSALNPHCSICMNRCY